MGFAPRDRPKQLGTKLLAIRQKLCLSQSQMAKLLGFEKSFARLSEYEHGNREPCLLTLLRYSKLARVSINMLVDDDVELTFPKNFKNAKTSCAAITLSVRRNWP